MAALSGKTVLLTGTLGRAQAAALAGAAMLLLDRPNHADGAAFAAEIGTRFGVPADFIGQNLGDLAGTEAAVRTFADARDGIGVLIRNAVLIINKPFEAFSLAEYEEQVRVNSSAASALARAVAPGMKAKSYGKIVNFCAVTLNGRWDGYVPHEYNDWILENQCLKALIQPQHVADLVLFLVSPLSDMITGQNMHIDGGW